MQSYFCKKLKNELQTYQIMLNEVGLPKLRVSSVYRKMVSRGDGAGTPAEAKEYVRGKLRSAFRLIKSIEERQRTIYKVAMVFGLNFIQPIR